MKSPFVSICIPAYNRPEKLYALLKTIDIQDRGDIEISISEDCSPRQKEIRDMIERFRAESGYSVVYRENEKNLGYDGNLRETVHAAHGKWIVLMGDDDEFIPGALEKLIRFLKEHDELSYVLRSYRVIHNDGTVENFKYYGENVFFEPGPKTYEALFRKSVFISGFTIKREPILPYLVDTFDGTALMQIYWVAELVLTHKAAYFNEPITQHVADERSRAKELMYDEEKKEWVRRRVGLKRSVEFLSGYSTIAKFMDAKHGLQSSRAIMTDLSKYSYPSLSVHRDEGIKIFLGYVRELNKIGFNITIYYYVYVIALLVFGRKICDWGIVVLKKIFGKTPKL